MKKAKETRGRPKSSIPCTFCRKTMGFMERREHEPRCNKNPKNRKAA